MPEQCLDMMRNASKKFMIRKTSLEPTVYTKVEESGVELTIRHLCKPRDRRDIEEDIWETILKEFPNTKFYKIDDRNEWIETTGTNIQTITYETYEKGV